MRRLVGSLVGLALGSVLLVGCGSSDPAAVVSGATFNPCTGLDAAAVSKVLDETVTISTISTDETTERCALVPAQTDGVAFTISYEAFDGALREALTADVANPDVYHPVDIAKADAAYRVVTKYKSDGTLAVTGFLQNGGLVEVVNVQAPPPYDQTKVVAATTVVMTQLSRRAASLPIGKAAPVVVPSHSTDPSPTRKASPSGR